MQAVAPGNSDRTLRLVAGKDHPHESAGATAPRTVTLLAQAVLAVGTPRFPSLLAEICKKVSGFESVFACAFFPDHAPIVVFDDLETTDGAAVLTPYLNWAYLLDPLHELYRAGNGDLVEMLSGFAPDDFRQSDYFKRFYAATGLADECGVILRCGGGAAIVLSLGIRHGRSGCADARARLLDILPLLGALARRHWPGLSPASTSGIGRIGGHVEQAFALFGTSVLSDREAEVAHLIAKGHSNKSIARRLGNSPETVKVHRKRIYTKLGVNSQGGFFSVFMAALSATPPGAENDPLDFLPPDFCPAH
ncbi:MULTISPECIES: LuxR family transcriptional regulator [unclassified Roseovarius]|uniref:helix-turn-helix transcriptional regulator n=1 Tax=unclassified Roseovarius TaxID=2614913 RepID=UPI00273E25A1|nr:MULTISPECIES: LuxR family transcriptional regulator [unclassified Roseovarius]